MCMFVNVVYYVFFFKQKTAYEMRISDWSSDVCSSDLPLYLTKLVANAQTEAPGGNASDSPVLRDYIDWLAMQSDAVAAAAVKDSARRSRVGEEFELPGPVGERNLYALRPRGRIALQASTPTGLRIQLGAVLATGNSAVVSAEAVSTGLLGLPDTVLAKIAQVENAMSTEEDRKSTSLN